MSACARNREKRNCRRLRSLELGLGILVLFLVGATEAYSQPFQVRGGSPTLSVTTAIAGSEPTPVTNVATSLRYTGQAALAKITVATVCPSQKFSLKVVVTSVNRGVAAPEVTLQDGMLGTNLITNIPASFAGNANASLQFTAAPLFSQGTGTDTHTVTYTYLAQ